MSRASSLRRETCNAIIRIEYISRFSQEHSTALEGVQGLLILCLNQGLNQGLNQD